jgi:hypothetical protein
MLLNDASGSFGMFSRAGRNSAEKYHIIARKDEILSGRNKKIKLRDIFTPDEGRKHSEPMDENIDIFKTETKDNSPFDEKKDVGDKFNERGNNNDGGAKKNSKQNKNNKLKKKTQFLENLSEKKKKKKKRPESPSCSKYSPKYECIWKRVLGGTVWSKSKNRVTSFLSPKADDNGFYLKHNDFGTTGKNFVSMAKQTKRGSFVGNNNIRLANVKSPSDLKIGKPVNSKSPSQTGDSFFLNSNSQSNEINNNNKYNMSKATQFAELDKIQMTHSSVDDFEDTRSILNNPHKIIKSSTTKNLKKTFPNFMNNTAGPGTKSAKWVKVQAPDFKKVISREQLEKVYGDKRTIIPFTIPKYTQTRARTITMVNYDKIVHKKNRQENKQKTFDLDSNYDPHKVLDKINNYKKPTAPNFKLMTSRPNEGDPLPAYMKEIHTRQATEMLTEKTLKMNNFSDGKFMTTYTSFWPKKSYNKIINLNLLNSEKENVGLKNDGGEGVIVLKV